MQLRILTFLFLTLSSLALLSSACTATLEEGCLPGPCPKGTGGGTSASSASGAADAGAEAEAGLNSCVGMDPPATGDFPCDVFEVIHRTCNPCHTMPPLNGAPFPLLTFEDTQKPYPDVPTMKIYQTMNGQIRPGAIPRMPLGGKLNDADLKILGDWLNSCAPPAAEGMGCECPGKGCTP